MFGEVSGNYGHDQIFRSFLGLPSWFSVNAVIQHGWYRVPHKNDLRKPGIYFAWSSRMASEIFQSSGKKAHVLGAPFVLYRRRNGLKKQEGALGTVAFPQHSSPSIDCFFDIDEYCESLSKLGSAYKPITICLHHRDMAAWGESFEKRGFSVVTAGPGRQADSGFVKNFYAILSSHRYATSNDVGSYLFYAVEMGIPFFLTGEKVSFRNKATGEVLVSDPDGAIKQEIVSAFRFDGTQVISDRQAALVASELGVDDSVGRRDLLRLVLIRYFRSELPMALPRLLAYGWLKLFRRST